MELHVLDAGKVTVVLLDNDMKIVKPVYDFLKFQQQKSKADNTLLANGRDLCLFWTFLGKSGYAYDQVTPRMIAEFIDFLRGGDDILALYKESSRSNRTINRILSTVHTFYQYQADMQEIDNPMLMHDLYKNPPGSGERRHSRHFPYSKPEFGGRGGMSSDRGQ